jgi:general secretion pathway protein L
MAQRILGLDLGSKSVKGVLIESTYRGFTVLDAASVMVLPKGEQPEPGPFDRQVAALRELLADRSWRAEVVVVGHPGAGVSTHVITLPFTDPRRIEQTIPFEVGGQIPFDLEEVAWDWQLIGEQDGKSHLCVCVTRKQDLVSLLAALAQVGIDPRIVLPAGPAYASLFGSGVLAGERDWGAEPEEESAAEAILDIGHERSSFCLVASGRCEAARTFSGGGAELARALARELGVGEAEAGALLEAEVSGTKSIPAEIETRAAMALRSALVPLARELRTTLKAWQARVGRQSIRRLLLAGEVGRLPGLGEILGPEVGSRAEPLALAGPVAEKIEPERAPGLALPLALALRGHQGSRGGRLNLRRGELSYTRDFEHLKGKVTRLAAFAGLVLLLALVSTVVKVVTLSRQEALLDKALCDVEQKALNKCYPNFEEAESALRGRGTAAASVPSVSAVAVLAELAARTPGEFTLRYERIDVTHEKLHLQGITDAAENVDKIVSTLKGSRCFAGARSGGARRRGSDGKFEFSIDSDLSCEVSTNSGSKG